ncbi:hypothetical protein JCM8547_005210, partial [Rhodosporidiobolus lusitaniae]
FFFDSFKKDENDVEFYYREFCYKDFSFDKHDENGASPFSSFSLLSARLTSSFVPHAVEKQTVLDIEDNGKDKDKDDKDKDKHYRRSFDSFDKGKDYDFDDDKKDIDFGDKKDFDFDFGKDGFKKDDFLGDFKNLD